MENTKIKLENLINYLGEPEKHVGAEYYWQCPLCMDSHRDNLKFNEEKGILWCFADDTHAPQVLKSMYNAGKAQFICNNRNINAKAEDDMTEYEWRQDDFSGRTYYENIYLLSSKKDLSFLLNKRGISKETVKAVKLGFDGKWWRIPQYVYTTKAIKNLISWQIMSCEYRPADLSKNGIHREKNTPTNLAMINRYTEKTEALVIVEGFFDGYALFQHLTEKGQAEYYHIITPSNGVNTLFKNIYQIEFDKYKRFYLFIDNDKAGNNTATKILEKYPMFERIVLPCGCKDFNEHYLKCIKLCA